LPQIAQTTTAQDIPDKYKVFDQVNNYIILEYNNVYKGNRFNIFNKKKMKTNKKILKIGGSKAITLPENIVKKVKIGDEVLFDIEIIDILHGKIRTYKCLACEHQFDGPVEDSYCPACGNENLKVIQDE
jgi:Zn finger protein HypA/HybF involved in hydrogenase expression